jgi:uncharacterized protein
MTDRSIELVENQSHETRDGVRLIADIFRPTKPGRYPTLLMRTPYDKVSAQTNNYAPPQWFARQGFVVVVQDVRGRGASGGEFYPFRHEADDGEDCIEWVAGLPFSNGVIGMYGLSYPGVTQMQAAKRAPQHLTSIAPAMTSADYHEGWTYRGGALELAFATAWARMLASGEALRHRNVENYRALTASYAAADYSALPLMHSEPLRESGLAPYFFDWLHHPGSDDYWRSWALADSYKDMTVPALHIGGWWDIFLTGTLQNFAGMKRSGAAGEQRCIVGPWTHAIDESQLHCPELGGVVPNPMDHLLLDWFDHTLRGETLRADDGPVRLYVLRADRWMDCVDWPPPDTTAQTWYLASDGRANSDRGDGRLSREAPQESPPDCYIYDPLAPVPSLGGASCCSNEVAPMGPAQQGSVETLNAVLVYTSEPFDMAAVLVGRVHTALYAATSGRDTDFVCRLCVVDRDGRSTSITDGILRGRYREGVGHEVPTRPHNVYLYDVELQPTAVEIRAGERLRLQVTSSAYPRWDRNTNTGGVISADEPHDAVVVRQEVFHEAVYPSRVTITLLD